MLDKLDRPQDCVKDIISCYLSKKGRKGENSKRIKRDRDYLIKEEKKYEEVYNKNKENYTLISHNKCGDKLKYLDTIYRDDLVKKEFQRIIFDNNQNRCAICGRELVEPVIDHVLPKSEFPEYRITPINLVPICNDCNFAKNLEDRRGIHCIYNSYLEEKISSLQSDFQNGYNIIFLANGTFKMQQNIPNQFENMVIESYRLDKRIKYRTQLVINRIINQIEFIFNNSNNMMYVSSNMIGNLLDRINYKNKDLDSVIIQSVIKNKSGFELYVYSKLKAKIPSIKLKYTDIETELNQLKDEYNINPANAHFKRLQSFIKNVE